MVQQKSIIAFADDADVEAKEAAAALTSLLMATPKAELRAKGQQPQRCRKRKDEIATIQNITIIPIQVF